MSGRRWPLSRIVVAAAIVVVVLGLITVTRELAGPGRRQRQLQPLVQQLRDSRLSLDSCRAALRDEQARFRAFDRQVDSLRQVADGYTVADGRVPAERYDEYLAAYRAYNGAVSAWQERADTLRAHWSQCSDSTAHHNAIADSLRRLADPDGD